jgi:hypothetical protein
MTHRSVGTVAVHCGSRQQPPTRKGGKKENLAQRNRHPQLDDTATRAMSNTATQKRDKVEQYEPRVLSPITLTQPRRKEVSSMNH